MAALTLCAVHKRYDRVPVLHGIDLEIADGEFVVFVGPSGCGKSTLLRCIAGLEEISDGELRIDGERMNEVPPAQRGLSMVFQSYALYPHMTVAENMSFGLRLAGLPGQEIAARVRQAALALQLEPLLERRPAQLSGGQRQRVAIGRAIVRQPRAFLFDEPLSNLDAALRVQMRMELSRLHAELGTTMLYVTHDQSEAMTLADRIVVFNGGRIEQVGPPMALYREPANQFVAGFLGSPRINLLPAAVLGAGAPPALARVGVRPEHLQILAPGEEPGQAGRLQASIRLVEPLGDSCHVHLHHEGSDSLLTANVSLGDAEARLHALRPGVAVRLHWADRHQLGFDASGRRIALSLP